MCPIPPTGAPGDYGTPTVLEAAEFEARISATVLGQLDAFQSQQYRPDSARRLSKDEFARFAREHDMVSVTRFRDGVVEVTPFERVRGGYAGLNAERAALRAEDLPSRLPAALTDAFASIERAGREG